jgi:lipoprotein-anchoring transpeptidase ErfK/SrfK
MSPSRLAVALVVTLVANGCSTGTDLPTTTEGPIPPETTVTTRLPETTAPPVTTPAIDPLAAPVLAWLELVGRGDMDAAWDAMAESSRLALGSKDLFVSFGTELEEGWGAWASAEDLAFDVGETVDHPRGTVTAVEISGTVSQEGMSEDRVAVIKVVTSDGVSKASPFEEFDEIAERIYDDERPAVPADSGTGRRIVYANVAQRVWLIEEDGTLADTYLVSGRHGVPAPGTYQVFSKSETAAAGHDGITMQYMVRFTRATSGVAIGFHSIPYWGNGRPMQSEEELGEFRSAGCVRQSLGKAATLFEWAPVGTVVVVLP